MSKSNRLPRRGYEDVNRLGRVNGFMTNTYTIDRRQAAGYVEFWFDRHTASWAVIPRDGEGYQVGQSQYVATRGEAISVARHMAGREVGVSN